MNVLVDVVRALGQLNDPRFLRVLAKGVGFAITGLALVSWLLLALVGWIVPDMVTLPWLGDVAFFDNVATWTALGLMLLLSVVLMVPVAALVVGFFLEDVAAAVEERHYPHLPPVEQLPLGVQVADGAKFLGVVAGANLLAFAAYIALPPLAPLIFLGVNGYLLGREYFHLVAMRRLGPEGATALRRRHGLRVWLGGVAMAVPLTVPVVNLLVPVVGVAVFTHQFHRVART